MNVPVIHVHTQSDKSTIGYVTFMWETMLALATHPAALKLSIHCIGPSATERLQSLPQCKTYYVPNADPEKGMSGSTAHGACIEHALQTTDDGDIHILVDSDTVVLAKGWDDLVRREIIDRGVGAVGTTYESVGGFTSGGGNVQTYKGIPNVVWMAMSPRHRWRDLRAMPKKDSDVNITNEGQAKVYGLPVGYRVLRDVGWQIPEYLASRGISYVGWHQLKPTKDALILKGLSDYHEEYHVDQIPFVVHHRGSLRHAYRGDRISQNFYSAVDRHLAEEKTRQPHWIWQPTAENQSFLDAMATDNVQNAARVADIEMMAGIVPTSATKPTPETAQPISPTATISGWLKATLDSVGIHSRYTQPVPATVDISFTPDSTGKHLRLEGTVANVAINLPFAANDKPHWLTVRNMTAGPAKLQVVGAKMTVDVPSGVCWQVLVDVDGPVHVQ